MSETFLPRKIVIHHSGTDAGDVETFRRYHVEHNGWQDVGYHFVVDNDPDGQLQYGRAINEPGAHCRGHNAYTIGICLVGDGTPPPTRKQLETLVNLLLALCATFHIEPDATGIVGHRDLCVTDCPGDALYAKLPEIREGVRVRMQADGLRV